MKIKIIIIIVYYLIFLSFLGTSDLILSADYPVEIPTLSKTLKAVVGALAASQNIERANKFVREIILTILAEKDLNDLYHISEPFEALKNILARDGLESPEPRIIGQSSMNDILSCYNVGIYCDKRLIGQGRCTQKVSVSQHITYWLSLSFSRIF